VPASDRLHSRIPEPTLSSLHVVTHCTLGVEQGTDIGVEGRARYVSPKSRSAKGLHQLKATSCDSCHSAAHFRQSTYSHGLPCLPGDRHVNQLFAARHRGIIFRAFPVSRCSVAPLPPKVECSCTS